jgi:hypothetical protein
MKRKRQQGSQLLHFPTALSLLHPFYSLLFLRQNSGRLRKLNDNKIGKISSIKDETFKSARFAVHKKTRLWLLNCFKRQPVDFSWTKADFRVTEIILMLLNFLISCKLLCFGIFVVCVVVSKFSGHWSEIFELFVFYRTFWTVMNFRGDSFVWK